MKQRKRQYQATVDRASSDYRDALKRLIQGIQTHPNLKGKRVRLSPTNVALEARRSRNPLYTTHKGILEEIKAAALRPVPKSATATAEDKISELRRVNKILIEEKRQLASENAQLLYRATTAERMLAEKNKEIEGLMKRLARLPVPLNRPRGVE